MPSKKPPGMTDNWKPKWAKDHAKSLAPTSGTRFVALAMQFAIALAISLFLMIKLGTWLDAKLGTTILFTALGIIFAVFASLFIIARQSMGINPLKKEGP